MPVRRNTTVSKVLRTPFEIDVLGTLRAPRFLSLTVSNFAGSQGGFEEFEDPTSFVRMIHPQYYQR